MSSEFKSFFKKVAGNEGDRCHYAIRLDTYGCGCQHNCGYCYARALLDFRKLWNPAQPSIANINRIRHTIRTRLRRGDIVRLGGMTDCFQPLERENRITQQTIQALNEMRVGYLIVTKSDLVAEPEYLARLDPELAHVQISLTITDEKTCKRIEPGAPGPGARIKAIERLQEAGIDVQLRLSPFIPELVDLAVINSVRCDKILVEFLRVNSWIRKWLSNLDAEIDLSGYTEHHNGYDHLPLAKKRGLIDSITGFREVSVCEDVEEHQRWWDLHVNANPDDCCNLRGNHAQPKNNMPKIHPVNIPLSRIRLNEGQVDWLPRNPRQWTREQLDRLAESIQETPQLLEARGLIVYPHDGTFVVIGGNMRLAALTMMGAKDAPCYILPEDMDREKVKEIVLKDNGDYGLWNQAMLSRDWADLPLERWGVEAIEVKDYSDKNKEINVGGFNENIVLKLKYNEPQATLVSARLGEDKAGSLLKALGYED